MNEPSSSPVFPTPPPVPGPSAAPLQPRSTWKKKLLIVTAIVLGTATVTVAGSAWWVKRNVYASAFQPVQLTTAEQGALNDKLHTLQQSGATGAAVDPETAKRTLTLSDREINAFLEEQGLGEQVKVSLRNGGATAAFLLPLGEGGEPGNGLTLRLALSVAARMDADKKFSLSISDVSVGGVPLPNAWLGNMKGLNLFADSPVSDDPTIKGFLAGIRDFNIQAGQLRLVLNE